jgi:hypothetical protein
VYAGQLLQHVVVGDEAVGDAHAREVVATLRDEIKALREKLTAENAAHTQMLRDNQVLHMIVYTYALVVVVIKLNISPCCYQCTGLFQTHSNQLPYYMILIAICTHNDVVAYGLADTAAAA